MTEHRAGMTRSQQDLCARAQVTCRFHGGPMRLDFPADRYACAGFDGEGCDQFLSSEELALVGLLHELAVRGLTDVAAGPLYWTKI